MEYLKDEVKEENQATIKCVWEICRRNLSPLAQARVRDRVVKREMTLQKAVANEGVMFCRTSIDLSEASAMFQDGVLEVDTVKKGAKGDIIHEIGNTTPYPDNEGHTINVRSDGIPITNGKDNSHMKPDCGVKDPQINCRQPQCVSCKDKLGYVPRPKHNIPKGCECSNLNKGANCETHHHLKVEIPTQKQ